MPDYAPASRTLQQYKTGSWRISAGNVVGDLDLLAGLGNDAELERTVRLMAAAPDLSLSLRLITEEAPPTCSRPAAPTPRRRFARR